MDEEYPIYTENGKLFCKCRRGEGKTITLLGKNGAISFARLVDSVTGGAKHNRKTNTNRMRRAQG